MSLNAFTYQANEVWYIIYLLIARKITAKNNLNILTKKDKILVT